MFEFCCVDALVAGVSILAEIFTLHWGYSLMLIISVIAAIIIVIDNNDTVVT